MANVTLTTDRFPAGTTVGAYAESAKVEGAAPSAAALTTAVVAAAGTLAFTGLADDARFVAYASVGGEHRYVTFTSDLPSGYGQLDQANVWTQTQTEKGALDHDGTTVGFYGVTPTARPSAYTQTYSTATRTHAAVTSAAVATTAATQTTPWGYASQAQADAIPVAINAVEADLLNLKQFVNSIVDDLQANGLLQ